MEEGDLYEIKSNVYIISAEMMISDQKDWDATDICKNVDFNTHKYWLVVLNIEPEGFDSIKKLFAKIFLE